MSHWACIWSSTLHEIIDSTLGNHFRLGRNLRGDDKEMNGDCIPKYRVLEISAQSTWNFGHK
jgi:hypothetical protein